MKFLFLHTSRKALPMFSNMLPTWAPNCPDNSSFCQVQARKRGVLGWAWGPSWGCFVYVYISKRGVLWLSKEQRLGVVFWAKGDPTWTKWEPSGQFVWKVGKSALERRRAWALVKSLTTRFFCIFEKSGKNEATDLAVNQLRGSTIIIISAHVPGQHV